MWWRWVRAGLLGATLLTTSALARAQCTKDVECKGDRICEAGTCTAPPAPEPAAAPAVAVAPAATEAPAPASAAVPAPAAAAAAPAASATLPAAPAPTPKQPPAEQPLQRRSRGAFAGGIIMISVGSVLLAIAAVAHSQEGCPNSGVDGDAVYRCNDRVAPSTYALFVTGGLLAAGGIPMIIYGAKRVPAAPATTASVLPWATSNGAGLRLRFDL